MAKQPLKYGEKVLFLIFGVFLLVAVVSFGILESVRAHSQKPMFPLLTHYNLSPVGEQGSQIYHKSGCSECHRAMGEGTNMGLDLDGLGSRHSQQWIEDFLRHPEKTYKAVTFGHGADKGAAYVAQLPGPKLHAMAVFLSELTADRGAPDAPEPPRGDSQFINSMLKHFAPPQWRHEYKDIRTDSKDVGTKGDQSGKQPANSDSTGQ